MDGSFRATSLWTISIRVCLILLLIPCGAMCTHTSRSHFLKLRMHSNACMSADTGPITFAGIKLTPPLSTSLLKLGISNPSPIQNYSIAAITAGISCILHAETGSGKTLAYLLPLLKRLQSSLQTQPFPLQALLIVPTKELAVQVAADINALVSEASNSSVVHLCITTSQIGFDDVATPIVIGTPIKILNALQVSRPSIGRSFNYIVLDEVDRLLATLGKYATAEEKSTSSSQTSATEQILTMLIENRSPEALERLQVVAASATVGRPLRRDLHRIIHRGSNGNFPVLRPNEDGAPSLDGNIAKGQFGSTRKIGIPSNIKHIAVLVNTDETNELSRKLVVVKEAWVSNPESHRSLLFVPRSEDIKNTVGMLKFWGLSETRSLQDTLGLAQTKPESIDRRAKPGSARALSFPAPRMSSQQMIQQATSNRIGTSGRIHFPQPREQQEDANQSQQEQQQQQPVGIKSRLLQRKLSKSAAGGGEDAATIAQSVSSSPAATEHKDDDREMFVTSVSGTRGLHLQDVEYVFITQPPRTMDEYLHMAGRTGRQGNRKTGGTVMTIVTMDELKRLQSWQTALGVAFELRYEYKL